MHNVDEHYFFFSFSQYCNIVGFCIKPSLFYKHLWTVTKLKEVTDMHAVMLKRKKNHNHY